MAERIVGPAREVCYEDGGFAGPRGDEVMLWVWVVVTVYASGEVNVDPGTNLSAWDSRASCEAALVGETDFGYTAGWEIRSAEGGTTLVYEQPTVRSIAQCFPVYAARR